MASRRARLLLFEDGTVDPVPTLRELSRGAKHSATLNTYLRLCALAIQAELTVSTSASKRLYPRFSSIIELAEWLSTCSKPQIVVQAVLLCVAQIGVLVREFEADPSVFLATEQNPIYALGLCNGMIGAAALAASKSTISLLRIGPRLVRVNLRLLLVMFDRSTAIEESAETWTVITPHLSAQDHKIMIANFVATEGLTTTARLPYVSAEANEKSTISGPPSSLAKYFSSCEKLIKATKLEVPINTACHAPHLRFDDLDSIVGVDPLWRSLSVDRNVKFLSIHTGSTIEATDLNSLLHQCADEVLNQTFRWGTVLAELVLDLKTSCDRVLIYAMGPDRVSATVKHKLADKGIDATVEHLPSQILDQSPAIQDDIAIVGFSGRLPGGGNDLRQIWQILKEGRDTHGTVPNDRFDLGVHYDSKGQIPNTTNVPFGCFIDQPGLFDAKLFNMSPREARQTDPMQRLALMTTYEALEMAGYSPNARPSFFSERIGSFFGQTLDDYRETNACQDVDIYYIPGGVRAFGPGRLNYHFKWEGPSMSVDTACSSSALAIQLAFQSLRNGECDLAVAGGMNIITSSDMYAGLAKGGFLSKTGQCKPFGDDADGYCRGEGVGTVVLKRLQDALADHDNIIAIIKSAATNHSAFAKSITHPDAGAQVKVMRQILRDANISPANIDYVEMHGTGTQAGDPIEISSVSKVFGLGRNKHNPVVVGSIKANVGHAEAAAGINSLIKVLLMLQNELIPANIGVGNRISTKFPQSDLTKVLVNTKTQSFTRQASNPRRIVLNSFNAAGGNTAMVIEDAPRVRRSTPDPRSHHIIAVTGHTKRAFLDNRRKLLNLLQNNNDIKIADLAYTTTARRLQHSIRKSIVVRDLSEARKSLSDDVAADVVPLRSSLKQRIIFAFTGQGSHHLEMARSLLLTSRTFRDKLSMYCALCQNHGFSLSIEFFQQETSKAASQAQLHLSIVVIQLALVALIETWGIKPDAVIGHSIGEYAALATAGVLSVADTLYLVGNRGRLVEETCQPTEHAMLAVSTDEQNLKQALSDTRSQHCVIACHNGPLSFVLSGPKEELSEISNRLSAMKISNTLLGIDFGYHSPQMESVGKGIKEICRGIRFSEPRIPVASTFLGKVVHSSGVFDAEYLASQTLGPVLYYEALEKISGHSEFQNHSSWLEIGTHPVCRSMITSSLDVAEESVLYTLRRNEQPWLSLSSALAGLFNAGHNIEWARYHEDHHHALWVVDLPTYSFDLDNFWIPYRNNWKLSKGCIDQPSLLDPRPAIDPRLRPFHYLDLEKIGEQEATVRFLCDLREENLFSMIQGHLVEGVGLCPSSVYAHLAYNAAGYIFGKVLDTRGNSVSTELANMEIISPLMVSNESRNNFLAVEIQWRCSQSQDVRITFSTSPSAGEVVHCRCTLSISDSATWRKEWQEHEYLILSRANFLRQPGQVPVHSLHRDMIYYLFSSAIVKYSQDYQVCNRLSIDYDENECLAELRVPDGTVEKNGSSGPYCLDALMHATGFVLNSSPKFSEDTVFIASGWSSLKLMEPLRAGETYLCYSRMAEGDQLGLYLGNVSILSHDRVIGTCRGLKFHKLKRASLHKLLGVVNNQQPSNVKPVTPTRKPKEAREAHNPRSQPIDEAQFKPIDGKVDTILEDIANEIGVTTGSLTDETNLSALGIDSLMSIELLKRFKGRTSFTIPANIFSVCTTIAELKRYLADKMDLVNSSGRDDLSTSVTSTKKLFPEATRQFPEQVGTREEIPQSQILCEIIATEVGISLEEVREADNFAQLGVDSLLMVSIISGYKARTGGLDLSARFFNDHPSLQDAFETVDGIRDDPQDSDTDLTISSITSNERSKSSTPATSESISSPNSLPVTDSAPLNIVSMLIQGTPDTTRPAVFFLPDGSGSLFSYIHLPELQEGLPVYAFDSPFHKNPSHFNVSFADIARAYVQEVRKIQPHGPYMIAGWSLGGVHAYEVTRQLLEAGEEVQHLIMMDSPCPGTLPPLPNASLDLLEKAGIFKALSTQVKSVADHTRQHFVKITDAFQRWDNRPLRPTEIDRLGSVSIIWARHGVLEDDDEARNACVPGMDKQDADMLKAKEWLTGKRTDFSDGGWRRLVGKDINILTVAANHFSMMFPPKVSETAAKLREIL